MSGESPAASPAGAGDDDDDLQHVNPRFPKAAAGFTLPPSCLRAERVRERLRAAGMGLGL